ncbi:conserved protein, unknown function [Plasmodium malariae]|uniref:Uncharacterized protein n=1 Tax=Plasmodium malariae TaxID=5858 RepID=A0A1C3L1G7_PLAMA|nr:conserved protein, unknown function [Plasmodium malariae]SBT80366.1 conserved protein, unknown function [Plasmodium malariae]SCO94003.1 conserved protein, unknown function [Plasmodium malariae]
MYVYKYSTYSFYILLYEYKVPCACRLLMVNKSVTLLAKNVIESIPSYIKKKDENILINLRVKPNAKNTSIYFNSDKEVLNISIQEQPVNNQSNVAIISYFSDILNLKKRDISIVSGLKSRDKVLMVSNISLDDLNNKITENVE